VAPVTGHGDKERAVQRRHGAQTAGDFVAVHTGQADVHQHHFGLEIRGCGDGLGAGKGGARYVAAHWRCGEAGAMM
jgi:hypothetical protein